MKFSHLPPHLSATTRQPLEEEGWPLTLQVDALAEAPAARSAGWDMFPLAAEFLSAFSGFGTATEEELYLEAWPAVPIREEDHAALRELRQTQAPFPVGLAAGWVNVLLTEDGTIFYAINGHIHPGPPLDRLICQMLAQRQLDLLE